METGRKRARRQEDDFTLSDGASYSRKKVKNAPYEVSTRPPTYRPDFSSLPSRSSFLPTSRTSSLNASQQLASTLVGSQSSDFIVTQAVMMEAITELNTPISIEEAQAATERVVKLYLSEFKNRIAFRCLPTFDLTLKSISAETLSDLVNVISRSRSNDKTTPVTRFPNPPPKDLSLDGMLQFIDNIAPYCNSVLRRTPDDVTIGQALQFPYLAASLMAGHHDEEDDHHRPLYYTKFSTVPPVSDENKTTAVSSFGGDGEDGSNSSTGGRKTRSGSMGGESGAASLDDEQPHRLLETEFIDYVSALANLPSPLCANCREICYSSFVCCHHMGNECRPSALSRLWQHSVPPQGPEITTRDGAAAATTSTSSNATTTGETPTIISEQPQPQQQQQQAQAHSSPQRKSMAVKSLEYGYWGRSGIGAVVCLKCWSEYKCPLKFEMQRLATEEPEVYRHVVKMQSYRLPLATDRTKPFCDAIVVIHRFSFELIGFLLSLIVHKYRILKKQQFQSANDKFSTSRLGIPQTLVKLLLKFPKGSDVNAVEAEREVSCLLYRETIMSALTAHELYKQHIITNEQVRNCLSESFKSEERIALQKGQDYRLPFVFEDFEHGTTEGLSKNNLSGLVQIRILSQLTWRYLVCAAHRQLDSDDNNVIDDNNDQLDPNVLQRLNSHIVTFKQHHPSSSDDHNVLA